MVNLNEKLIEFLNYSHSEYHSVNKTRGILLENGFVELDERQKFNLIPGGKYFVVRNLTSLIAFIVPKTIDDLYFKMVASHADSPTFKIKENPVLIDKNYEKLKVEGYGGMIHSVWLDKPLSMAGRIVVKTKSGLESRLIDVDKDLLIIPNVAIHQNREINGGYKYSIQKDLCPIIGETLTEGTNYDNELDSFLKEDEKLIATDLYLYNRAKANYIGSKKDFLGSPKLDDLASAFLTLEGFIDSYVKDGIAVYYLANNEEVGSLTMNGADSTFLSDTLRRITFAFNFDEEMYYQAIAKSILISADNAHAIHPNSPELSDNKNFCLLNKGVVIKHNANMFYTTDALSSSLIKEISNENDLPYQEFFNHSDVRGGSTLGNISNSHVSVLAVDIGLPQLAMHSNFELIGTKDIETMYKLIKQFMSKSIKFEHGLIKFN